MKYAYKKFTYRILVSIFDILGGIVFYPFKFLNKTAPLNPKNILVVRLDHIGDFVCTTPLFKNLKKRYPSSQITVLVNSVSKELARRDPNIDKVISFSPFWLARGKKSSRLKGLMRIIKDVKNIGFDLGIEPRGDILSILIMWLGGVKYRVGYGITGGGFLLNKEGTYDRNIHVVDRNLALLKELDAPIEDKLPAVYFDEKDMEAVERLLGEERVWIPAFAGMTRETGMIRGGKGIASDKAIVIHPFAGAASKELPRGNFQKLIDMLKKDGWNILLVGSDGDLALFSGIVDMRGKLSLPQLACLIKRAGFFIGSDSGPANIAAALNVPSVIICSGTNIAQLWIPNSSNVKFVYKNVECKPCENKVCPKEKHECMDGITAEEVLEKLKEI